MKQYIDRWRLRLLSPSLEKQVVESDELRAMMGRIDNRLRASRPVASLRDAEFRVFSQFGEDGIIQFLVDSVPIEREVFVEIGVEDYSESNTRFLLVNNNWKGFIFDQGSDHISFVQRRDIGWRHDITPISARITRENIDRVLEEAGVGGDIGLFSLDIDGNDYWVLDALSAVSPRILVLEYNSVFGPTAAVTIPYDPSFDRQKAHYSHLYWGASLAALDEVASRKGYQLVGSNSAGNNAFFVRKDVLSDLPTSSVTQAYVQSRYRDARDENGQLSYSDSHTSGLRAIDHLPVWNVREGIQEPLGAARDRIRP